MLANVGLRRCDTSEFDGHIVCRKVLGCRVVNAVSIGSFHPNINSDRYAIIANTACDLMRTRVNLIIISDLVRKPTGAVAFFNMLVGRRLGSVDRVLYARPSSDGIFIVTLIGGRNCSGSVYDL